LSGSSPKDLGQSFGDLLVISPKWLADLPEKRAIIYIPKFLKILDEHTSRQYRTNAQNSRVAPELLHPRTRSRYRYKTGGTNFKPVDGYFVGIFDQAKTISSLNQRNGKKFNVGAFIGKAINYGHHPGAIYEALKSMVDQWNQIDDLWAWGKSVATSCNQKYKEQIFDIREAAQTYGAFFTKLNHL
jgi:hypothetical protein